MPHITSFTLGNFRAFGPAQTFPIKPITLIYGQNSAGKSSVLDAVLFASHLAREGSPCDIYNAVGGDCGFLDTNFDFTVTGSRVQLGTAEDFFHRKDATNPTGKLLLGFDISDGSGPNSAVRAEIEFMGLAARRT